MSDPRRDTLMSLLNGAIERGDTEAVQMIQGDLQAHINSTYEQPPSIKERAEQAMGQVKVDPLAGFREGGPGIIPEAMRPLEAKPTHERMMQGEMDYDPWKGVAYLGRGAENLAVGLQQIGGDLGEKLGVMTENQNAERQEKLTGRMAQAEDPYNRLKQGQEGAALLGEIVGESVPFMGVPVPRLPGMFTGIGRLFNPAIKHAPEAAVAGTEAMLPYAETPEERVDRGKMGAAAGTLAKMGTDYVARRASSRRQIMDTDELQEMHDIGADFGLPLNKGKLDAQVETAGDIAQARTGGRMEGSLASTVSEDLSTQVTGRVSDMNRQFDRVMEELDNIKGYPLSRGSRGQFLAQGMLDVNPIRAQVDDYIATEIGQRGMANPKFMSELDRWSDLPENVTMKDLNKYRRDMRSRRPKDPDSQEKWDSFDAYLSDEMYRHADRMSPGSGDIMRNMDEWTHSELPRLQQIPAIKKALGNDATPQSVLNWMMSNPGPVRQEVADMLTTSGRHAVTESFWNQAYRAGTRGRKFNPLSYSKYLDSHLEAAGQFMDEGETQIFENLSKVMRHISDRGAAPDSDMLKMIRGYPFLYRAVTDRIRNSNFVYMMKNVPKEIRPGSPAMERWYRGFIRGLAIQEPGDIAGPISEPVREEFGPEEGWAGRMARQGVERLFPSETDDQ